MKLSRETAGVGFLALGTVRGGTLVIAAGTATIDLSVDDARRVFYGGLGEKLP
jgi:hypothetical protein